MQAPAIVFDHRSKTVVYVPTGVGKDPLAAQRTQVATSGRPRK